MTVPFQSERSKLTLRDAQASDRAGSPILFTTGKYPNSKFTPLNHNEHAQKMGRECGRKFDSVHLHADNTRDKIQLPSDFWDLTELPNLTQQLTQNAERFIGDDQVQNIRDEASRTLFLARSMYFHNTLIHPATKFVVVTRLGKGHNFFGP